MNLILFAIPFFFLLIALELVWDWHKKTNYYRVNDAITSLSLGIVSRVIAIARKFIPFTLYYLMFDHISVVKLSEELWVWVLGFVLYDFCYYWLHRLSHEVNFLWAAHVVHHSSEEYNLTTALRQTSGGILGWVFYLPMAVIGIPPEIFISVGAMNLIYQFWVHTRHIPKLGWYEWVFVTPSNHRVHHAQNQVYIDRNYGGVFILWDRMFGTFQEELDDEAPIYGIRKALKSWDPIWANLHVYWQLGKDAWNTKHWKDKLLIWFKPTGWRPDDVQISDPLPRVDLTKFKKFDIELTGWQKVYSLLQHIGIIGVALVVMIQLPQFDTWQTVPALIYVLFASYSLGLVLSNNKFGTVLEIAKYIALPALLLHLQAADWMLLVFGANIAVSLVILALMLKEQKEVLQAG